MASPETDEFDVGDKYHVELIMVEPDVVFHLYIYGRPWPKDIKKRIIQAMDARITDSYTAAYEKVADSWFIRIFDFCSSRMSPRHGAKTLIEQVVRDLIKSEVEDGSIRVPGAR